MSAAIDRPLSDDERALLLRLTQDVVQERLGVKAEVAAVVLYDFANRGQFVVHANDQTAIVELNGQPIVVADRDWTAYHADVTAWENDHDEETEE